MHVLYDADSEGIGEATWRRHYSINGQGICTSSSIRARAAVSEPHCATFTEMWFPPARRGFAAGDGGAVLDALLSLAVQEREHVEVERWLAIRLSGRGALWRF